MPIQVTKEEVARLYPMRCISGFGRGPFIDTGLDIAPGPHDSRGQRMYISEALVRQCMNALGFASPEEHAAMERAVEAAFANNLRLEAELVAEREAEKMVPVSELRAELESVFEAGRAKAVQELVDSQQSQVPEPFAGPASDPPEDKPAPRGKKWR